ncbi:DinI-like family protein [Enterobacteriaceae bacterium H20N1]|uniref:DinI-like family protein n=1 Tax=Dryocola boscaweniae TaxID=2925397 RepID=A0A9X3AMF2_9ENTR|nr:DinI-like family protein [Dryocola boscaweniae]MCT4701197.1 DinI-like family protein [Dryocola boscaweniae]MCT4718298.1 DinI-like family protein [Dryocola boscaweniae]
MKVEVTIDRTKKLPAGAIPALQEELQKRLARRYEDCHIIVRQAGSDGLSVTGVEKDDKKLVEEILKETWESADDWFEVH